MMKKLIFAAVAVAALPFSTFAQSANTLSAKEKADGWQLLFNGMNADGWHVYNGKGPGAWKVSNGIVQLDPKAEGQGDLVTDKEYENFELKADWKIPVGGNSGIIFSIHEDTTYHATYLTGMEMQVLDDIKADDNKKPNHLAGSFYDMIAPSHAAKPAGEWNSVVIKKLNGHVTFWMNGEKVVEYTIGSPEWNELIKSSKYVKWTGFARYPKGHIALQDHGAAVAYRNISIKEL